MSTEAIKDAMLEAAAKLAVLRGKEKAFSEVSSDAAKVVDAAEAEYNKVRAEQRKRVEGAAAEVEAAKADLEAFQNSAYESLGIMIDVMPKGGGQVSL